VAAGDATASRTAAPSLPAFHLSQPQEARGQRVCQPVFKYLRGRKVLQLQEKVRRHLDCFFRNQSDDFAAYRTAP